MRRVLGTVPGTAVALLIATIVAVTVTVVWSLTSAATIGDGPAGALGFWHHRSFASYLALAGGATGNGFELFLILAGIYMTALVIDGIRRRDRRRERWEKALRDQRAQQEQQPEPGYASTPRRGRAVR